MSPRAPGSKPRWTEPLGKGPAIDLTIQPAELALLIGTGIMVLPAGLSRKILLGLACLAAYQALQQLSYHEARNRLPQSATDHPDQPGAELRTGTSADQKSLSAKASVREEAIYPRIYIDRGDDGRSGSAHYRVAGDIDMEADWWSVTVYDGAFNLISSSVERHSFTSLNIVPTADGRRFVIDIAPECPAGAVNWLPCRRGETFTLVWRFYLPGAQILDPRERFEIPRVIRVAE